MSCPATAAYFTTLSLCVSIGPIIPTSYHNDYFYSMFLPTDADITAEYVKHAAFFRSQDFAIPIILLTKWMTAVGTNMHYTNFQGTTSTKGSCAFLKPDGMWDRMDCSENRPILIVSRPQSGLPNTCMSQGVPFYRFNCPGTVHKYSQDKSFSSGYCRSEQFCYTGSDEYSKDCRALRSTDAFTRKTKEYALLLELLYVTRNGLGMFITDQPLSTDTEIQHMGYCSPGPCVYGSTFALHWVQAHDSDQKLVDNLYTASRDEAVFLDSYVGNDETLKRYHQGYKGIVCYIWTDKPSFNCSYCFDDTVVVPPPVDTFSWYPLLIVSFIMAYFASAMFYKNSNLVLFLVFILLLSNHTADASLIDDILGPLLPKSKTTPVVTLTSIPVGTSKTQMSSSIPLTSHILSTKTETVPHTTKQESTFTSKSSTVVTEPLTILVPTTAEETTVMTSTPTTPDKTTPPTAVVTPDVTSTSTQRPTVSVPNDGATKLSSTTPETCDMCQRDAGVDIINILIFMLIITIFSRNGVFLVALLSLSSVRAHHGATCNVTQVAIDDLCWLASDASLAPVTNVEIPLSADQNQLLVADMQKASSSSIYPYLSCVFLPIKSCDGTYCDLYGNKLSYIPLSPVYSSGDYLAIVIDDTLDGVNVGDWISIASGTYCTNFVTTYGGTNMSAGEIGFLILLIIIFYSYAAYS